MRLDGEPVVILLERGSESCVNTLYQSSSLAWCQHSTEQDDWSQQMTMVSHRVAPSLSGGSVLPEHHILGP